MAELQEKRLRALAPEVTAYVDFIQGTPGLLRHQFLRRLWARHQRWGTALFGRTIARAHRYHITSLETIQRIALLYLQQGPGPLPLLPIDEAFREREAYQEGSLTDPPELSAYQDPSDHE